jgi:hypothetical protein
MFGEPLTPPFCSVPFIARPPYVGVGDEVL